MLSDSFKKRARSKKTALAVAFSVVAGGIAVATVPVLAPAYAAGGASVSLGETSISPSGQIDISGSGFDPEALVYVQVVFPDGNENLSWNSTPLVATSEGNVAVSLVNPELWAAGEYTIALTQNEEKSAEASLTVVAETPEPTETTAAPTETPEPTETGTPEPTATATGTPEPTETSTPEPTQTEPATPEPTSTQPSTPEPTPTETTAPEPTSTATPEPTGTAGPAPTTTETPAPEPTTSETPAPSGPAASAEHATLTPEEAKANGVAYVITGFPPETPVELTLTLPDGTNAVFGGDTESIVTDADGNYAGKITYSGDWPLGDYAATVEAKAAPTEADTAEVAAETDTAEPAPTTSNAIATFTFRIATDGSLPGTGGNGAVGHGGSGSGGSGKGTASNTGTGSSATGSGKGSSNASGGLATTGAEDLFGAAGIGLLVLAGGAGVYAGARFINRRRKA